MKVILDTNVMISAFATRGLASSVFELCLDKHTIIISEHILSELKANLQSKIKLPKEKVETIIKFLKEFCVLGKEEKLNKNICRDKNDNKILGLALAEKPDYIITGDDDLLILKKFNSIPIIKPREFWEIVKTKKQPTSK